MITQVLALGGTDPLAGLVDPDRIAAAGHSDGEVISFGVGFLQCCRDPRVRSVIAMAGDLSNANNPHVRDTGTPILHIMETNDEYDPYPHSIEWDRENLTAPRWMVTLNSSHVPPYTQPGDPAFELASAITVAFLDGTLKGHPERLDQVTSDVMAQPAVGTHRALTRASSAAEVDLHLAAQDLARRGLGHLVGHDHELGRLERAEPLAHPLAHVVDVDLLDAGPQRDHRRDPLAVPLVVEADDGGDGDGVVLEQRVLDLGGRDVLAAADDRVVGAALAEEVALDVEPTAVAGVQPTVGVGLGVGADVLAADLVAADLDLSGLVGADGRRPTRRRCGSRCRGAAGRPTRGGP